jgi:DNA-binding SARP family transcriptional activator
MVRIQLCGRFAVVVDGEPTESRLPGRQGRLLVAYLATYRVQPVERTVLLDALWPDGGAGAAGALTVLLSKVRTLLAPAEIRGRRTLQLILPADSAVDLETATTSLHSAESAVALQDWRRAWPAALAAQYVSRRRFLAEFEAPWIDEWRRQLDVIYERALACYGEACLGIGGTELPAAERAARHLLAHAPLAETGHRLLMRALAARGDAAAALAAYGQLRQLLREELGGLAVPGNPDAACPPVARPAARRTNQAGHPRQMTIAPSSFCTSCRRIDAIHRLASPSKISRPRARPPR